MGIIAKVMAQKELLLQTALSFSVRILGALSAFLVSVLVGRQLGAEQAGYYFLAFSIITFLAAISRVGFDDTVLRFTGAALPANERSCMRSVLKRALLVSALASTVVALLLAFASEWLAQAVFNKPALAEVLQAASPAVVGLALFTLLAMSLQGLRRVAASVFTLNISINLLIALGLLLLGVTSALHSAWLLSAVTFATLAIGALLLWPSLTQPGEGDVSWQELWQSCLPLWVVMIMAQLTQLSGQFIAGAWVEPEQVAQLAVAQRTAMLTSFILLAVNVVVAPRFAVMYKQGDYAGLQSLAINSVRLMVLFALPIITVMMLFPAFLMGLFGEGFRVGAQLLQIMAVGQFINVATGPVGFLLTMSGHEKDLRNTVLISGPLAVAAGFALVPLFGATGSAIATALAVATQNLVAVWWVKKRLGFNTLAVWR